MYSCSGSECKELLASLGWREVAQALDDPALVVALTKFRQRVRTGVERVRRAPALTRGFLRYTGLFLALILTLL